MSKVGSWCLGRGNWQDLQIFERLPCGRRVTKFCVVQKDIAKINL
jgi:hypothetical protein